MMKKMSRQYRWAICAVVAVVVSLNMSGRVPASIVDAKVFINELHYDNAGADAGEFVEVLAPLDFAEPSQVQLTRYNGSDGTPYSNPGGKTSFSLADDFTLAGSADGFRVYLLDLPSGGLQNGAPDGLALWHATQGVLQLLSYEGTFSATAGPAEGLTSTDIGVSEPTSTPAGYSLQLVGQGDSYADFAWSMPALATAGTLNGGQAAAVPEPSTLLLATLASAAFGGGYWRRRRRLGE